MRWCTRFIARVVELGPDQCGWGGTNHTAHVTAHRARNPVAQPRPGAGRPACSAHGGFGCASLWCVAGSAVPMACGARRRSGRCGVRLGVMQ